MARMTSATQIGPFVKSRCDPRSPRSLCERLLLAQDFDQPERPEEVRAGLLFAFEHAEAPTRQHRDDDRTEQHHDPRQVDPEQEDRQRGERSVDQRVGRHELNVERKKAFHELECNCGHGAADQRVLRSDAAIRNEKVEQREGGHVQQDRHCLQQDRVQIFCFPRHGDGLRHQP